MQNLESALTPCHMAYMFRLFHLTGGFQDNSVFRSAGRSFAPEEDHWAVLSPPQGLHWWVTVEKAPAVRFDPGSAHPDERQERAELTPGERTWTKELNHLKHSRFAASQHVLQSSPLSALSVAWGYGGLACACLGCHGCWMECGVSCPCSTSVCLCASLAVCSLSCFFLSLPFPPHPHLSVSVSLSLPPSLSIPQFNFSILSPLLSGTQVVFVLVVISNPVCLFLVLQSYQRCSISPLTLVCCLRFFSWVLFLVFLAGMTGRVQVFGWRTRQACGA